MDINELISILIIDIHSVQFMHIALRFCYYILCSVVDVIFKHPNDVTIILCTTMGAILCPMGESLC